MQKHLHVCFVWEVCAIVGCVWRVYRGHTLTLFVCLIGVDVGVGGGVRRRHVRIVYGVAFTSAVVHTQAPVGVHTQA